MVISLLVSLTLIPMLSSLRANAPLGFAPEAEVSLADSLTSNRLLRPIERGMGGIGWLLRKLFGSLMFAITWLITVLARVLRASVGRALGWLGEQLMKAYDVAASAYARIQIGRAHV